MTIEHVRARRDGLLEQRVGDDLVVYDQANDTAHALNASAAAVWSLLDQRISLGDLVAQAGPTVDEAQVRLAILELARAGLLTEWPTFDGESGLTRRSLLRKMAIAAVAAPLVTTIFAASPAAAAAGDPCSLSNACTGTPSAGNVTSYSCYQSNGSPVTTSTQTGTCRRACANPNDCKGSNSACSGSECCCRSGFCSTTAGSGYC